jgi:hypothetical protein
MGLLISLANRRVGSNAPAPGGFDPNSLFTSGQYGDFMRASESAPAASGGLLTRWTGQRASAASGARFDITPFGNAADVGAFGPNGEQCIRMVGESYLIGSLDRGGISEFSLPAPFNADTSRSTGFTIGLRYKKSTAGDLFLVTLLDGGELHLEDSSSVLQYKDYASTTRVSNAVSNGVWNTVILRHRPDASLSLTINGTEYTGTGGSGTLTMFRWLTYLSGSGYVDVPSYFYGHMIVPDESVADLSAWLEG